MFRILTVTWSVGGMAAEGRLIVWTARESRYRMRFRARHTDMGLCADKAVCELDGRRRHGGFSPKGR